MGVYLALVAAALLACAAQAQRHARYDSRYDYLDVDAILDSRRLVRNYVECLVNMKPCSPEGKALKRILPEALRTKCARCTERQRQSAVKVIKRLKSDYPNEWSRLAGRWDPNGDFTAYFEHVVAKEENDQTADGVLVSQATGVPVTNISAPTNFVPLRPIVLTRLDEEEDTARTRPPSTTTISPSSVTSPSTTTQESVRVGSNGNTNKADSPPVESIATSPVTQRPTSTTPPPVRIPEIRPQGEEPLDGSVQDSSPTKVTFRPVYFPVNEYPGGVASPDIVMANPLVSSTMGIIGHFSTKIIRTTELVTDILRNTVRTIANVG